ncbi:MAG: hypothetical protein K2Y35_10835 [Burkholderiales bacterium]|nr:hypothetical protein [Burkholderiales bacterium]
MPFTRIGLKFGLLLLPLVAVQVTELLVLPLDAFTFRFWEAMIIREIYLLPGPLYPNRRLDKWSAGDQAPRGPRKKFIRLQSDEFGQRNPPGRKGPYEVVVIGDSNIVGSNIDEHDTIRAAMERECGCSVYAYGAGLPLNILSFLSDKRFEREPPKWVVMEFRPGDVEKQNLPIFEPCFQPQYPEGSLASRGCALKLASTSTERLLQTLQRLGLGEQREILELVDRALKQSAYRNLHARLGLVAKDTRIQRADPVTADDVAHAVRAFNSYRAVLAARDVRLLLFSMHNGKRGAASVSPWLKDLREAGFDVISIDTTTTPPDLFSRWWPDDDSHWREESIRYSAGLIWREISRR